MYRFCSYKQCMLALPTLFLLWRHTKQQPKCQIPKSRDPLYCVQPCQTTTNNGWAAFSTYINTYVLALVITQLSGHHQVLLFLLLLYQSYILSINSQLMHMLLLLQEIGMFVGTQYTNFAAIVDSCKIRLLVWALVPLC